MDIVLIVVAHIAMAALVLVVLSSTIAYVHPDVRPDGLQRYRLAWRQGRRP
jgi:hypothetical protein